METDEWLPEIRDEEDRQGEVWCGYERATWLVWWLTPIIPALWEAKVGGSPESEVLDQPSKHGETPSLLKT